MNQVTSTCLEILQTVIKPPTQKEKWRGDPFEYILEFVKEVCHRRGVTDWIIDGDLSSPSTSSTEAMPKTVDGDVRVKFTEQMMLVYEKLADSLEAMKSELTDEYTILSLQQFLTVSSSLQFFVLSAVLPYLDDGVGAGASARSTFIKSWKRNVGDVEEQSTNLSLANRVFFRLFDCNEALKSELTKKFLDDILCINFQLENLGRKFDHEKFESFLTTCPKEGLITSLSGLLRARANRRVPAWLQSRVGIQLSSILTEKNGLGHFLVAYNDMGGEGWYENIPMRKNFGVLLARVPKKYLKKTLAYHTLIYKQFVEILTNEGNASMSKCVTLLLTSFIEAVDKLYPGSNGIKNADLVIFDHLLRFYEILAEKSKAGSCTEDVPMTDQEIRSLTVLAHICSHDPSFILPERLFKTARVFVDLCNSEVEKLAKMAEEVSKYVLSMLDNMEEFIYLHVMTPMSTVTFKRPPVFKNVTPLIQEMDGDDNDKQPDFVVHVEKVEDADADCATRLETVCRFIEKNPKDLMKLLAKGVERWLRSEEEDKDQDRMRFLDVTDTASCENETSIAHLVVGYCFERLSESMESFDEGMTSVLLDTSNKILKASVDRLVCMAKDDQVLRKYTETDQQQVGLMLETCRMCVGVASGAVLAAKLQSEISDSLEQVVGVVKKLYKVTGRLHASGDNKDKLSALRLDAKMLLSIFDESSIEHEQVEENKPDIRKPQTDAIEDILNSLDDPEVAIIGSAFIRAARVFQSGNSVGSKRLLQERFYEKTKKAVEHENSYIYLAAINCLCEIACYDRSYLQDLIDSYASMQKTDSTDEESVVRRGRMGEALAKVFCCLGEVSLLYVERLAAIFLKSIGEKDPIIRASACSSMGSIVLATRGRGIEKHIDEMLMSVNDALSSMENPLVRRAAVNFVRQTIRSCSTDLLQILGTRLRDIRRKIMQLWRYDSDEVVRLHAQLCVEELDAAMEEILAEEQSHYIRRINI